jgi:selenocysteine lyase/cysteine desulfurase
MWARSLNIGHSVAAMPTLTDEAIDSLRREQFPILERCLYLDYATFGPPPGSAVRAAAERLQRDASEGSTGLQGTALLEDVRAEAARLLHSEPRSVCLLTSTSEGMNLVAAGLDWRPGDEVLVYRGEFEGCTAPFLGLPGVRVQEADTVGEIPARVGKRTRAVALSIVDRVTGARAPVEDIAAACRGHGAWLALDAAQAMGVLDLDPQALGADVVTAHGYKFLLAGFGLAPTWCSDRAPAELRVPRPGWKNAGAGRDSAARFEPTMFPLPVMAAMRESLRLLNSFDPGERERRALAAARAIAEGLDVPPAQSTLVCVPGREIPQGVVAATVDGRLRLSTHFFTTRDDADRLLERL